MLSTPQPSRILDGQEIENDYKVTHETLKHRILVFTQVAFWPSQ